MRTGSIGIDEKAFFGLSHCAGGTYRPVHLRHNLPGIGNGCIKSNVDHRGQHPLHGNLRIIRAGCLGIDLKSLVKLFESACRQDTTRNLGDERLDVRNGGFKTQVQWHHKTFDRCNDIVGSGCFGIDLPAFRSLAQHTVQSDLSAERCVWNEILKLGNICREIERGVFPGSQPFGSQFGPIRSICLRVNRPASGVLVGLCGDRHWAGILRHNQADVGQGRFEPRLRIITAQFSPTRSGNGCIFQNKVANKSAGFVPRGCYAQGGFACQYSVGLCDAKFQILGQARNIQIKGPVKRCHLSGNIDRGTTRQIAPGKRRKATDISRFKARFKLGQKAFCDPADR